MTEDFEDDPFAIPEDEPDEIAIIEEMDDRELGALNIYKDRHSDANKAMQKLLPYSDRKALLYNHKQNAVETSKHVLDGFGIERVIEAYAMGLSDEDICKYIKVRESQLTTWIAMSSQRVSIVARLRDIQRAEKVKNTINATLDYEVSRVFDKSDESFEKLKLEAQKMKGKTAMDLDQRSRGKDDKDEKQLPIVQVGFQINTGGDSGSSNTEVKPVMPFSV